MFNRLLAGLFLSALTLVPSVTHAAEDPQYMLDRGKAALESGLADEAIAVFSELLKTNPQAAVYYHRGLAYSIARQDVLAIQDFDRASSMEPEQALYHLRKGISLARIGNYQDATKSFSRVLELDPGNVQAFAHRAKAYFSEGQSSLALNDLTEAIRRTPDNAGLYRLRGDIHSGAGEFDSAVQDYDTAIRLKPNDPAAHNNRGIALANLGKIKEAVDDLNRAMDIASSTPSQIRVPGIPGNPW
jgi:tetratricopeptide (TPR) repeat protein